MRSDLEKKVFDIIESTTKCKFTGRLHIEKEEGDPPLWGLFLYLDTEYTPITIAYQGTEEKFLELIKAEIKSRKLQKVKFWRAIKIYDDE